MSATEAQIKDKKSKAFLAKGAIHWAMTLFTQHWGQMLQVAGEEACQANARDQHWRDVYDQLDGTGHDSVDNEGDFSNGDEDRVLKELHGISSELTGYRSTWDDFTPAEEQATAYAEAMVLLDQVDTALGEAKGFVQACLPQEAEEDGTDDVPGATGDPAVGEGGGTSQETTPDP